VSVVILTTAAWLVARHLVVPRLLSEGPAADVAEIVLPTIFTGLIALRVSYRRFDSPWWLLPPIGVLILIRLAWRASLLPYRNWPPRHNEVVRMRWIEKCSVEDNTVYVLDRTGSDPG
jgi:hypothetical protein